MAPQILVEGHTPISCPAVTPFSDFDFGTLNWYVLPPLAGLAPDIDYGLEGTKHLKAISDESLWALTPPDYAELAKMTDAFIRFQSESYSKLKTLMTCIHDFNARAEAARQRREAPPPEEDPPWWKFWRR